MEHRKLGWTDVQVSEVGLGGNTFGPPRLDEMASIAVVRHAVDLGVNFIDTANVYGGGNSETFIGKALHGRRDQVVIATKFNLRRFAGDLEATIRVQVDESLGKLGTDRIDLLQLHAPHAEIPAIEVQGVVAGLIDVGKVRYSGVCNYSSWRLCEASVLADEFAPARPVSVQNYYNLLARGPEYELLDLCRRYEISLLPYHPLAGGFLTGKYRAGEAPPAGTRGAARSNIIDLVSTDDGFRVLEQLGRFAAERNLDLVSVAIGWLLTRKVVPCVIAGVSSVSQLEQNIAAAETVFSESDLDELDSIVAPPVTPERPPYSANR